MKKIRKLMNESGVWEAVMNFQIYETEDFIQEFDDMISEELKALLRKYVSRIQRYCDERIIEPK